jgi:hypothetical protein
MRKKTVKRDWKKEALGLSQELGNLSELHHRLIFEFNGDAVACELNMTAYEDAIAHSKLNHALLTEALDNLNLWKRIWQTDTRYYYEQARKQADTIAALVEGNKALRAALDKHELFHVKSRELRA